MKTPEEVTFELLHRNYSTKETNCVDGVAAALEEGMLDYDGIRAMITAAVEADRAQRIQVGDVVEHVDNPELDARRVITIGEDWLWLDFQEAQLTAGDLPPRLPLVNYRKTV